MCSVICRKAKFTVSGSAIMFPDANSSFPEHKIEVFVLFGASKPSFSGVSSTKSAFLCAFGQYFLGFSPRRAQNRGFCALFFETVGSAERVNLVAASARRGNLFSAPAWRGNMVAASAWRGNLIATRKASGFAELSCRLSSHRGKWRGITAPPTWVRRG